MPKPALGAGALSARVRLACALALSLVIALLSSLFAAILGCVLGFFTLLFSRISLRTIRSRFWAVNVFILFIWLIVPFTTGGPFLVEAGFLRLSEKGLSLCLLITFKANALLAIFTAFLTPLSLANLGQALLALGCSQKLALLFLLMERNVFILRNQWTIQQNAAKLRGFAPKTSLRAYKTIAALLALLLLRAYDYAQILREAMLLRGFDGKLPELSQGRITRADIYLCVFTASACAILLCSDQFAF